MQFLVGEGTGVFNIRFREICTRHVIAHFIDVDAVPTFAASEI
jgi:hypothetical protein